MAIVMSVAVGLLGYVGLQISNAARDDAVVDEKPVVSVAEAASEQIIVTYKPTVDANGMRERIKQRTKSRATEKAEGKRLRVKVLKVPKAERAVIIEQLRADPAVEAVSPDAVIKAALTQPDDPMYEQQWNLPVTLTDLLWDKSKGSDAVTIAIIDSGINASHPEFAGRIVPGKDFVNGDDDPADDNSHGTAVASIAAAKGGNGIGIAGSCWHCKIMPLKVLDEEGLGVISDGVLAVDYAVANGAKVINMSFGGEYELNTAEKVAVDNAVASGVVVIAAADNNAKDASATYPAAHASVISVAATLPLDTLISYSNFGASVDIAAPGDAHHAAHDSDDYSSGTGTSYAAPLVAGIAGVLRSAFPNATVQQIREALTSTADPCCDAKIGGGRVNAIKAYNRLAGVAADTAKPTVGFLSPAAGRSLSGAEAKLVPAASDNVGVVKVHFNRSEKNVPVIATEPPFIGEYNTTGGADGQYNFRVRAYDAAGNFAEATRQFVYNNAAPADTSDPTVAITAPAEGTVISGNAVTVTATATDNPEVAYVQMEIDGTGTKLYDTTAPYSFTLDASKLSAGNRTIKVTAFDHSSRSATAERTVRVETVVSKPGDLNNDGKVNISDLSVLLSNWGKTGADVTGDINKSGKVDISDLSALLSAWTR